MPKKRSLSDRAKSAAVGYAGKKIAKAMSKPKSKPKSSEKPKAAPKAATKTTTKKTASTGSSGAKAINALKASRQRYEKAARMSRGK